MPDANGKITLALRANNDLDRSHACMTDVVGGDLASKVAKLQIEMKDIMLARQEMSIEMKDMLARQEISMRQMLFRSTTAPAAGEAIKSAAAVVPFAQLLAIPPTVALAPTPPSVSAAADVCKVAFAAVRADTKANEAAVQKAMVNLMELLSAREEASLRLHDTHATTALRAPLGKIDVSFTTKEESDLTWSSLVTFMELKGSLLPSEAYHGAISQLYSRAEIVFSQQPERLVVIAAVASADRIEFWRFEREADSHTAIRMQRTSLAGLDMTGTSEGCVVLHSIASYSSSSHKRTAVFRF